MTGIAPPQPPPKWKHSAADIVNLTKDAIEEYRKILDEIGSLDPKDCTFESVFIALQEADARCDQVTEPLSFYHNVSAVKELRDASNDADALISDFSVESAMSIDLFNSKVAAEKNIRESGRWDELSPEEQRLIKNMRLYDIRAGLALPEAKRNELETLYKELSDVCLEFSKNFNEENGIVSFTEEELEGVPEDVISGYIKRSEGDKELYDVAFKTPDISPVFEFAENPETRKRALEAHEDRLSINIPLLDKALELRRKIATILGYKSWADYVTAVEMIKSGKGVQDFLHDLERKLLPVGLDEKEILLSMKKKEHEAKGLHFDGHYYIWDHSYYNRKYIKEFLDLDDMLVKEYFPVSVVVPTILSIYQNLLGVQFQEMKNASTWHPDVQAFEVWEKDAKDESDFLGYCYLDMFPRANKYSHAAVWPILPGYSRSDGTRSYPVTAMVANLAKPTPDKPALMRHEDVVTFFHEMGHVFHNLLSKTKFAMFHGTSVARDFVEAPSQMLENWCWEPAVLERISSHYETQEPLSPALIEKLVKSRYVNIGLYHLRQLCYARFDLKVHTDQEVEDCTLLWNTLREEIALVKHDKACPSPGSFTHSMCGYDAAYYGYTYSLVFAADMYATIFRADPLDPACGKLYRDKILNAGGTRDALDILEDFLGRPPNSDAFMEALFGVAPVPR